MNVSPSEVSSSSLIINGFIILAIATTDFHVGPIKEFSFFGVNTSYFFQYLLIEKKLLNYTIVK